MLGIEGRTIRRWFDGYTTSRQGVKIEYPAWMNQPDGDLLTFTDLIELWFVKQFQVHGVRLPRIRSTYHKMAQELRCPHPFLKKNYWLVVSKNILTVDVASDRTNRIVSDPESRQLYLNEIALDVGNKIEFDPDDFARRWFPLGRNRPIQVDPAMGHGETTITGRRLRTKDIFNLWKAEDQDNSLVKEAFRLSEDELEAALEWELLISKN